MKINNIQTATRLEQYYIRSLFDINGDNFEKKFPCYQAEKKTGLKNMNESQKQ